MYVRTNRSCEPAQGTRAYGHTPSASQCTHRDTHQQVSTCTQGVRFYVPGLLHLVRANSTDAGLSTRFGCLLSERHQIFLRAPENYVIQILLQGVDYVDGRLEFDVGLANNQPSSSLRVVSL